MAKNSRKGSRRGGRVVQIRSDGDSMAARIDRTISSMRQNESSAMILCSGVFDISAQTSSQGVAIDFISISQTDDFISLAQQFNEFKVKSIRFDIFHTRPQTQIPVSVSTLHCAITGSPSTTYTGEAAIADAPDAAFLDPTGGKQTWYWNASGPRERDYQDMTTFTNFGGLRYNTRASGTAGEYIASIIMTACVVVRGRH